MYKYDSMLVKSLDNLIESNNGYYKSDKQCDFLTSKTEDGSFLVKKRGYHLKYVIDGDGILSLSKNTNDGESIIWDRHNGYELNHLKAVEDNAVNRSLKRIQREIDIRKKSIEDGTVHPDMVRLTELAIIRYEDEYNSILSNSKVVE